MHKPKPIFSLYLVLCLVGFLSFKASFVNAQTTKIGQMPVIQAETLSERKVVLPRDLPGEKTLALIAFARNQKPNIETWLEGLSLRTTKEPWVELPIIEMNSTKMRFFINGGMRRGVKSETMRDKIITLYTERIPLLKSMGLPPKTNTIYVVIVTRSGEVLASVEGDYTKEKATVLEKALR